jgi:hypothetical protein
MQQTGVKPAQIGAILWPDSSPQSRAVLIGRWLSAGIPSIRLDQLKALRDYFGTTNINNLIDFEDETGTDDQE